MTLIQHLRYLGYKTLRDQRLDLGAMNVLTGQNNAGKSTALSGLRLLDVALRHAGHRSPDTLPTPDGRRLAYTIPTADLAVSLENVHSDLTETDSSVDITLSDGAQLRLWFPQDGGMVFYVRDGAAIPRTPSAFRSRFPFEIIAVPVLGPLEHDEPHVQRETVRNGLSTHRASRHFRNFWRYHPEGFAAFAALVTQTWPGMELGPPELAMGPKGGVLHMFCAEERRSRELYWCGFGFQIWCQLLTHISRASSKTVLVVDEPETYLHPRVQRALLGILRGTGAQVVVATHAAALIADAKRGEVVEIAREAPTARRYTTVGTRLCLELGLLPELEGAAY